MRSRHPASPSAFHSLSRPPTTAMWRSSTGDSAVLLMWPSSHASPRCEGHIHSVADGCHSVADGCHAQSFERAYIHGLTSVVAFDQQGGRAMSEVPSGPGWWQASDGLWYAPELHPEASAGDGQPFGATDVFPTADGHVFPTPSNAAFAALGTDQLFPAASGPDVGGQSVEYPTIHYPQIDSANAKSRVTAGVLAILLGWLGVHRFYLGYKKTGIAMLLLTALSLGRLVALTI